uniref:Uncharacterized protein n=1 Tax=Setaria italica TaxID=4555 RepID=K3YKR2_SETIT
MYSSMPGLWLLKITALKRIYHIEQNYEHSCIWGLGSFNLMHPLMLLKLVIPNKTEN